jgi:hypothetical protein
MANGAVRADQAVSFSDFEFQVILGAQLTELSDSVLQAEMMRAPPSPADSPSAARTALVIDVDPEIHAMLQTVLDPVAWKAAIANPEEDPIRHVVHREAKGLRPGGYGVLLAQKLVDELIYNEKGNEVLLVKYIDRPRSTAVPASVS